MKNILLYIALVLMLASCAEEQTISESANTAYEKAKFMLDNGDYAKANLFLEKFGVKHPYSQYTTQAELLRVFAAYKAEEYILSETLADRFLKLHPTHADLAYVKYLLAMTHYKQIVSFERDQTETLKSIDTFKQLIREHPTSSYAKDVKPRLQKLYNALAAHELNIGKFYFNKQRYVAAINRFQEVVKKHQLTPAIEEALYYMAASYAALGISENAHNTAVLLRFNYPKGEWSEQAKQFL